MPESMSRQDTPPARRVALTPAGSCAGGTTPPIGGASVREPQPSPVTVGIIAFQGGEDVNLITQWAAGGTAIQED